MCVTVGINSVAYGPVDKLIPPSILPKEQEGRKQGCNGGTTILLQLYTHKTHSYPCMTGRVEATTPSANPSGARPVPLDPLDRILVWAVEAGWSCCVTLAWSLTQYRYVPCGPDYQGTV